MPLIINDPLIDPVHVNNTVGIKYTNKGNALVRHVLSIDDNNPTTPALYGINDWQVNLADGQYDCVLTTSVYTAGALGRLCNSDIIINGQAVANMTHIVPNNVDRDTVLTHFTISIP